MGSIFSSVVNGQVSDASQLNQIFTPINNIESGKAFWGGSSTGTGNAYLINITPAISPLTAGQYVTFLPAHANTGASTLNAGTGAAPILSLGQPLVAGALVAGAAQIAVYDGASWHLLGGAATSATMDAGNGFTSGPTGWAYTNNGSYTGESATTHMLSGVPANTRFSTSDVANLGYPGSFITATGTDSVEVTLSYTHYTPILFDLVEARIYRFPASVQGTTFSAGQIYSKAVQFTFIYSGSSQPNVLVSTGRVASSAGDIWTYAYPRGDTSRIILNNFAITSYGV